MLRVALHSPSEWEWKLDAQDVQFRKGGAALQFLLLDSQEMEVVSDENRDEPANLLLGEVVQVDELVLCPDNVVLLPGLLIAPSHRELTNLTLGIMHASMIFQAS